MTLFDDQMDWHIDGVIQYADGSCETVWVNNQNDEAVFTPSTDSQVERYIKPCADCGEEGQCCQCHNTHDYVISFIALVNGEDFKKVRKS
jgi:hypothetical protein